MINWTRITYLEMQSERQMLVQSIEIFNHQHKQSHSVNQMQYLNLLMQHSDLPNPDSISNWYGWVD
jgi:hypothetical protein